MEILTENVFYSMMNPQTEARGKKSSVSNRLQRLSEGWKY